MALTLAVVAVLGLVLLGITVVLRHRDGAAGGACVVLAVVVCLVWFVGERRRGALEEALRASQETIAELESMPAQRGFTPDARVRMVEALGEFVGPTAFVLANSSDLETTEYAREIVSILKDAGWEVPPSFGVTYRPVLLPGQESVPQGVILGVAPSVPDAFATSIFNAFRDGGVEIQWGPHWPGTEHPISILVGPAR